jgi:endonuclease G
MRRAPRRNNSFLVPLVIYLWRYPRLHIPLIVIGVLVVLFLLVRGCRELSPPPSPRATYPEEPGTEREPKPSVADADVQMLMGNPSGATDDPEKPDNFLMQKPYFALSYNNAKATPNWVSWRLRGDDLGRIQRDKRFQPGGELSFRPDPDLVKLAKKWPVFNVVSPRYYDGSGFDRGHMCPFGDRTSTEEAAGSTFIMTNMVPQSPASNRNAWADFEEHCRSLVRKKHQTLYIVAGPQGMGGEGEKGRKDTIGFPSKVTVPAKCWKVVLALDDGKGDAGDLDRVSRNSRVYAVVMPNDQSVGHGWDEYLTSVKKVEELTGYHFFDRVPAPVIGPLKERMPAESHR